MGSVVVLANLASSPRDLFIFLCHVMSCLVLTWLYVGKSGAWEVLLCVYGGSIFADKEILFERVGCKNNVVLKTC